MLAKLVEADWKGEFILKQAKEAVREHDGQSDMTIEDFTFKVVKAGFSAVPDNVEELTKAMIRDVLIVESKGNNKML
jgi:hypothetical protein